MKTISVHITGFYRSSFHAYTTEVTVDGHRWRLGLRYSKFHEFYHQLVVQEKDFYAEFPPKGTLFFTPKPEERQEQLEDFLQQVLAYYSTKRHPVEIENLLCDLLKVPRHLRSSEREDDDVSTSTESVLDEPMHEPAAIEKKDSEEEEKEKTQVAETKVAVALPMVATEAIAVKEEEQVAVVSESAQPVTPVAGELCSVEPMEEETSIMLDTAEAEVVAPVLVEGPEVAQETIKEDVSTVDKEVVQEEEVGLALPLTPAEHLAAESEEAVERDTVFETHLEDPEVSPFETDVVPPTEQLVVKSIAQQGDEERAVSEGLILEENRENVKQKELATNKRASSWIAACLPKSLIVFFRRRYMKKTNLMVLCVALLLPMVLARR